VFAIKIELVVVEITVAVNSTDRVSPPSILGTSNPAFGSTSAYVVPFTVTEPVSNENSFANGSVKNTFVRGRLPAFVNSTMNVTVSPNCAVSRSTDFVGV
jgi:hypothetical protein